MVRIFNSYKSLTKFVIISLAIVIIYTISEFICSIKFGVHHDILTGCIFGLFGTEIAVCGFIKIFKIRKEEEE